ncbi:hypothetical protein LP316_05575 [Thalassotalea sp. LPB0316]|nr:hypothetical protein LP316_05575 [Thalassotalea sp. LPB0316]
MIEFLQDVITSHGYQAKVHFELEGCYQQSTGHKKVCFETLNQWLTVYDIQGQLIPEYWRNQWEFVSAFAGQTPAKEAKNLAFVIKHLQSAFDKFHYGTVVIKPVVWSGDRGKMAAGSRQIFSRDTRSVHIPNAIQMNVSVIDQAGNNLMVEQSFGERLQAQFIATSLACSLLYLPEEEAFERFALKTQYGLFDELCSPYDISGGHQGSIAFYKDKGKHNQVMGVEPLLYGADQQVLLSQQNWQATARIEHRLGAASQHYDPYINVIFALLNIIEALESMAANQTIEHVIQVQTLPSSLHDQKNVTNTTYGAISLFANDTWFAEKIDQLIVHARNVQSHVIDLPHDAGAQLKQHILARYQPQPVIISAV